MKMTSWFPRWPCLMTTHWVVLAGLLCVHGAESQARPPQSREMPGTIIAIDEHARTLALAPAEDAKRTELIWTHQTRFVKDGRFTTAAALAPGLKVQLRYRTPFFGKPFATKIVWDSESKQ